MGDQGESTNIASRDTGRITSTNEVDDGYILVVRSDYRVLELHLPLWECSGEEAGEVGSGCFGAWASWHTSSEDRGEECAIVDVEVRVWPGEVGKGVVGYELVRERRSDGKY